MARVMRIAKNFFMLVSPLKIFFHSLTAVWTKEDLCRFYQPSTVTPVFMNEAIRLMTTAAKVKPAKKM